jgi:hypothetical protein
MLVLTRLAQAPMLSMICRLTLAILGGRMPNQKSDAAREGAVSHLADGSRECRQTCVRYANRVTQRPSFVKRLSAACQWIESHFAILFLPIQRAPVLSLLILGVITLAFPDLVSFSKETYVATGAIYGAPMSVTATKSDAPGPTNGWMKIVKRIESRWTILIALGGVFSVIRVLKGLADSQTKYLKLDLTIDSPKAGDAYVSLTTFVENTLEDDRKIHNALILIGSVERSAQELLQALSDRHPTINHRVWCGQQLDTWLFDTVTVDGVDILRNTGTTWTTKVYPNPELANMECFLAACPLDPTVFVAGEGVSAAVVLSLPFYFEENDDIANERVSFPVAIDAAFFAPNHAYIARFYIIGEQPYPDSLAMSRCTAKGFVIPKEGAPPKSWLSQLVGAFFSAD